MAQENIIVTLPGGASGIYITTVDLAFNAVGNNWELVATHKDGTITAIDLTPIIVNLTVQGGSVLGNGDYALEVLDSGTGITTQLIIPLSNFYTIAQSDALLLDKVDVVPGMGLSEENFETVEKDKLGFYTDTMVSAVEYIETSVAGVTTSENIVVTSVGPAGVTTNIITELINKVDKIPGWTLTQNNFSDALKQKLDIFNIDGVRFLSYNAVTREVSTIDYLGVSSVAFVLPVGVQSDWIINDTNNPAFIKNKQIIQDQIDTNALNITANDTDIATNVAGLVTVNGLITAQSLDIATATNLAGAAQLAVTAAHTDIIANTVDIGTNAAALVGVNLEQITQNDRLTSLEDELDLEQAKIVLLAACCTTQEGVNTLQASEILVLEAQSNVNTPLVAQHTLQIGAFQTNLSVGIANLEAADTILLTEQLSQQAEIDLNTHCCNTQQLQIDTLVAAGTMLPADIAQAIADNPGTHTITDAQLSILNNSAANQLIINNDFANDIAEALRDAWNPNPTYEMGDIVSFGGLLYVANSQNTGQVPSAGIVWDSPFQAVAQYRDFTATPGQTVFAIVGKIVTSAFIYVNGVKIRDNAYTLFDNGTDTTLTLTNPAVLNQWVSVEF